MPGFFEPLTVGKLELPHRLVMAPMTRNRANDAGVISPAVAAGNRPHLADTHR
ncbi:hypothetical protein ACIRL2_34070 [Embleya sp. NPDC127516]|uniref:oxidoreductase n=1 Tax=Embleya sp. NPDC127516 TaxID=3363990 RepID=UPI003821ED40